MKKKAVLLAFPCLLMLQFLQGQCLEYFDNDLSLWKGDTQYFKVQGGYLHSHGPSSSSTLYLSNSVDEFPERQWEIGFRIDFNPSSSNFLRIYLSASIEELEKAPSAYFIQIGEVGGKNRLRFFKKQADSMQLIFSGHSVFSDKKGIEGRVKIIYNQKKEWQIYYGEGINGKYRSEGAPFKETLYSVTDADFMGLVCKYTTTSRATMYHFDHFLLSPFKKDNTPPEWEDLLLEDSVLHLLFSKDMDSISLCYPANYTLSTEKEERPIPFLLKTYWSSEFPSQVTLKYDSKFINKTKYELTLNHLKDAEGILLPSQARSFALSRPETADSADLIINEIMAQATDDCPEFIEIFHSHPEKEINLYNILLGIKDKYKQWKFYEISKKDYFIKPNTYTVLYKEAALWAEHKINCGTEMFFACNLPTLSDETAHLGLFRKQDSLLLDEVFYHKKMHFPLLEETEGISLERIEAKKSGMMADNWHSASESIGYCSAGCPNSQSADIEEIIDGYFSLSSEIISPNNDGIDDYLTVSFSSELASWCVSAWIYDSRGRLSYKWLTQSLLGNQSYFRWNGLAEKGEELDRGMYILLLRFEKETKKTMLRKKPLTIYK